LLLRRAPFLLLFSLSTAFSQYRFLENGTAGYGGSDGGLFLETPTRLKIDLAGSWSYAVEGGPRGEVRIPSAYDFAARVTFERSVTIPPEQAAGYDFELVVLGVNHKSEFHLNGEYLGNHVGGYTSFVLPVPAGTLRAGANDIRVEADNILDVRRSVPPRTLAWGWRNYGGVLRDIYLLGVPRFSLRDVAVSSELQPDGRSAVLTVLASVQGRPGQDSVSGRAGVPGVYVEVVEKLTGVPVARSAVQPLERQEQGWSDVRIALPLAAPRLWSVEAPDLYLVKCVLALTAAGEQRVIDEFHQNHGFRTLRVGREDILLNGKRIVLRGVLWNEDHSAYGGALTYEEMEKDVALIKNLGANAVRFAHHPPHPYMLNLCDRYGLLALQELPLPSVPSSILAEDYVAETAASMLREMITRDRHHPSVLAWGLGDDLDVTAPATREALEALAAVARSLDQRPLYYGTRALREDLCADVVDLVLLHSTAADVKDFRREIDAWKKQYPGRPVVVGRVGTEVQPDNRNGYSDPLSYEAQAKFFLQRLEAARSAAVDGMFLWAFNDWKTDRPSVMVRSGDAWIATMGLVGQQREKRLAYEAVRAVYRGEKFAALPIGSHGSGAPIMYVIVGLVILLGVAYLYNASRRFRDSLIRSSFNSFNFFTDAREQRMVSVVHSLLLALAAALGFGVVVSSLLHRFRTHWALDNLLSLVTLYDNVKEHVIRLIWDPVASILVVTAVVLSAQLVVWLLLMAMGPLFRTRLSAYNAFVLTAWSAAPLLILVPVGMILYRLTESPFYVLPAILLPVLLLVWVVLRLLKGLAIMTDAPRLKVMVLGILLLAATGAGTYLALDQSRAVSAHLATTFRIVTGMR